MLQKKKKVGYRSKINLHRNILKLKLEEGWCKIVDSDQHDT